MQTFGEGLRIQSRVLSALMIRELSTRFGRENIGFLWVMVEPLLFAGLVGIVWRLWKGPDEHGINIIAFVLTGYVPLTFFRSAIGRSVGAVKFNSSLMYHRQIKIVDFILVRFFVEMVGSMMAYVFIFIALSPFDIMPVPYDLGMFLAGWFIYSFFTLSLCLVIAPISEMSEVIEKLIPVTTYVMVPFSGTFFLVQWLTPEAQAFLYYSPPVGAMEMMRHGLFGHLVDPYYNLGVPLCVSLFFTLLGLVLCRRIRRTLIVE
jgi:capsular polysaccharide transport system permease protein